MTTASPLVGTLDETSHAEAVADVQAGMGRGNLIKKYGVTEHQARTFRDWVVENTPRVVPSRLSAPLSYSPEPVTLTPKAPMGWDASLEMESDGGTLTTGPVTSPITDWDELLKLWNLDPVAFEVVEPVTFKAWDMGYKTKVMRWMQDPSDPLNPEAQILVEADAGASHRLYSYKAAIRRKVASVFFDLGPAMERWRDELHAEKRTGFRLKPLPTGEVAYAILIADPQLGKVGTQEAIENWKRGVRGHIERIVRLRAAGHNISKILIVFMGDEHEGVANNYANQAYLVELNLSQQMELDYDLRVWTLKQVLALGLPVEIVSVISNHGEHTRNGSKDVVTTKSDNSSTMIARMVRRLFDETSYADQITWHIADDNPDIILDIYGVKTFISHGHIAKGRGASTELRAKNAVEKQILGRTTELHDLRLVWTAHYHHFYMLEGEGRTYFGCPALEAEKSSEYMLDQFGVWSPPGMLGMLVGNNASSRGWAEAAVL